MARFVLTLKRARTLAVLAAWAGMFAGLRAPAQMQMDGAAPVAKSPRPSTNAPTVAKSSPTATTNVATAAKPSATPQPPATPPPPMPDTYGRYGKILVPGDESTHLVKLHMPGPGFAEVKVPHDDELAMREKLEALWKLSDDDIRTQLEQWPAFSKMTLRDEGAMLQRIQDFRDYRTRVAQQRMHDMGLLTLTPAQKTKFETEYWDKRLQMDRDLCKQFGPAFKAREQKMQDELFREFSSTIPGPVPPPKPPASATTAAPVAPATNSVVTSAPAMAPSAPTMGKGQ